MIFTYLIFGIAMAYLESAVVVYLRQHYYPNGFYFPIKIIPMNIVVIEIGREAATLIMLWFVARMSFKPFKEKFALFIFTFGVWDIFYYFWLKIFLNWPEGMFDWDILFLIPVPWFAPWLVPVIFSVGLIFAALLILNYPQRFEMNILKKIEWIGEIIFAALILLTFVWQTRFIVEGGIPYYYQWWLFLIAMSGGLFIFLRHFRKKQVGSLESKQNEN
jgi:hypothetical protein